MKPSNRHKHNITLWVGRLKKTVIKASGKSSTPSAETRNEYDLSRTSAFFVKKDPIDKRVKQLLES